MKVKVLVEKVNKDNYFISKGGRSVWINPNSKRGSDLLRLLGVD